MFITLVFIPYHYILLLYNLYIHIISVDHPPSSTMILNRSSAILNQSRACADSRNFGIILGSRWSPLRPRIGLCWWGIHGLSSHLGVLLGTGSRSDLVVASRKPSTILRADSPPRPMSTRILPLLPTCGFIKDLPHILSLRWTLWVLRGLCETMKDQFLNQGLCAMGVNEVWAPQCRRMGTARVSTKSAETVHCNPI